MTVEFRVLPVQEAVSWIRAWTDHKWPMSMGEAFAVRDQLGWRPRPDDGSIFATRLSPEEDGYIGFPDKNGWIEGVSFPLSSRGCEDAASCEPLSRSTYEAYIEKLSALWGPGVKCDSPSYGIRRRRWIHPNGLTVSVSGQDSLIHVEIDSPAITQIHQVEEFYEEEGYLTPGTFDVP